MASKRHLESLDPVIFNKLPRLEAETTTTTTTFPTSLCKSSPVPNPDSENHFNYKGSYFACPLQSPEGPEQPLARWNPANTYLRYGPGAGSQPVPAEGPLTGCLLYRPESLETGLQPPGAEKGKESLVRELLMGREKWSSPPPMPGHPFPVKKPVAVSKASPLAIPKPVYRSPACFVDPRMALPLGARAESLQQRLEDTDWALPTHAPTSHPLHPSEPRTSIRLHKKGPASEPSLQPLHPSLTLPTKETVCSPVAFSPYYNALEKYRGPPGTPYLEASCPTSHSQRKAPEVASLSPETWPKLQPSTTSPAYQERSSACYPLTHYSLPLPKAAFLYNPPAPTMEAQPNAYNGFGFTGSEELFPSSYLKSQAPGSYFPSPLDTYVPRAAGMGTVASPPTKSAALPRDGEQPQRAGYLSSPGFAFSPSDSVIFSTSFAGTEPGCEWQQVESPQQQAVMKPSSAFQPICTPEKVPRSSGGLAETSPKGERSWVKPRQRGKDLPYPGRKRTSPAPQETHHGEPPAPIVVGKRDAGKVKDATKELALPRPSTSSPEGLKDLKDREVSPSSPPMPVINNVFSLAPYRDYLEGTEGSAQVPSCRDHLRGHTPSQTTEDSQEPDGLSSVSAMSSLLPTGTVAGQELKTGSAVVQSQGASNHRKVLEKPKLVPRDPGSQEGSPGGVGDEDPTPEDTVLDLSLKKKLVKARETQGPIIHAEARQDGEDVKQEKESPGGNVGAGEGAKPQAMPLLLEVGSGDKSNFQSSASFMFKKFKILRSLPPTAVPPCPASSPCPPQPSPLSAPAPSSTIPTPPLPTPLVSLPASTSLGPQRSTSALKGSPLDPQQSPLPEPPRFVPGEESILLPGQCEGPGPYPSAGQYFSTLHTWLCDIISCSVARSSPELLREWLKKVEPVEELKGGAKSPPKPKNGSRIPEPQKSTKGKEIWLAFQDVATLLPNLLSQLKTFMFARKCPFPHVVRAGAVFIPIHVVKEKLFPNLPGASVDQVLQEHKVELRPTTLSEEKHLRDLELKSCTSRMLKLLALKQLPDIYPDLLNLHWHNSIRQQLGSPGVEALKAEGKAIAADGKTRATESTK